MSSKTKTFEAESEFIPVIVWFVNQIKTKDKEIVTNTPPDIDVKIKLTKKYRITIHEFEGKKGEV